MAEDYESMTVAQLKELLKEQGLPVSGKKTDLIERLQEAAGGAEEVVEDEAPVEEAADDDAWDDDDWEDEGEEVYMVKQKPVLDEEMKAALALRAAQKKEDPLVPPNRMVPLQAIVPLWLACPARYGQQATTKLQVSWFPCSHRPRKSGCSPFPPSFRLP